MRAIAFFILCFFSKTLGAQVVSAYTDNRDYFYAFDNGLIKKLEYMKVKSFSISGNSIAYVDNTSEFKIYYDGQVYKQDIYDADFSYFSTGCIVPFRLGRALYVFDRGARTSLTYFASVFVAGDSILAFYDQPSSTVKVYYNNEVTELESFMLENPENVKAGSNLIAYIDQSNYFKIYYHGEKFVLGESTPLSFKAGADVVAFEDNYTQSFVIFYKGDTAQVETFFPINYQVGYGIVAYVNSLNEFKILTDGKLIKVSSFAPDYYEVRGNMIVYVQNNRLIAYYQGKETVLETYIPSEYQISNDGVAYKDVSGRLKFFWKGTLYTASYEITSSFSLNGDVLSFETGPKFTNFFFNGRRY